MKEKKKLGEVLPAGFSVSEIRNASHSQRGDGGKKKGARGWTVDGLNNGSIEAKNK